MQRKRGNIFDILEGYLDVIINFSALLIAYFLTAMVFDGAIVPISNTRPMIFVISVAFSSYFAYHFMDMYKPLRYRVRRRYLHVLIKSNLIIYGIVALIVAIFSEEDSRLFFAIWVAFSFVVSSFLLLLKHKFIHALLGIFKLRYYSLRRIIIVGDNAVSATEYVKQITENDAAFGALIIGYVGDKIIEDIGIDKLGPFSKLSDILDRYKPTDVVFAIDVYDKSKLIRFVNMCDDRCIKVYFLPVIYGFFKNMRQIEQVGDIPLINVHTNPLDNTANAVLKRLFDIIGSLALIIITSPIMLLVAIGVKLTSPGPVLFKQIRIGKMGKRFKMLKFRSMRVEGNSTKEWTTDKDERKTRFGNFIRKTSIDELPQLFNVLKGNMSLVGPRPEIPVFVDYFKETIPLYMVKHYVKPGLTGYAQIKGLRGDTSIEDRIRADIDYIENWSIWLDISILLKTPFKAINRNERYVSDDQKGDILYDETTVSR